jgi:protein phosphatase
MFLRAQSSSMFEVLALALFVVVATAAWLTRSLRRRRLAPLAPALPRLYEEEEESASRSAIVDTVDPECEWDEPTLPNAWFAIAAGVSSNAGPRATNEDAVLSLANEGLFAIADGMGGHQAGDVASQVALDRLQSFFLERRAPGAGAGEGAVRNRPRPVRRLVSAVEEAHRAVQREAGRRGATGDMGTTIVALQIVPRRGEMVVAHVGDSRCYRQRDGELNQLTADHTWAEVGVVGVRAGTIRRALGIGRRAKVDSRLEKARVGDRYVLCSDGLNKVVDDRLVETMLSSPEPPQRLAEMLVDRAIARGTRDNVSVIVVDVIALT